MNGFLPSIAAVGLSAVAVGIQVWNSWRVRKMMREYAGMEESYEFMRRTLGVMITEQTDMKAALEAALAARSSDSAGGRGREDQREDGFLRDKWGM